MSVINLCTVQVVFCLNFFFFSNHETKKKLEASLSHDKTKGGGVVGNRPPRGCPSFFCSLLYYLYTLLLTFARSRVNANRYTQLLNAGRREKRRSSVHTQLLCAKLGCSLISSWLICRGRDFDPVIHGRTVPSAIKCKRLGINDTFFFYYCRITKKKKK